MCLCASTVDNVTSTVHCTFLMCNVILSQKRKKKSECVAGELLSSQELLLLLQMSQFLFPAARSRGSDTIFWPSRAHTHAYTQHRTQSITTTTSNTEKVNKTCWRVYLSSIPFCTNKEGEIIPLEINIFPAWLPKSVKGEKLCGLHTALVLWSDIMPF